MEGIVFQLPPKAPSTPEAETPQKCHFGGDVARKKPLTLWHRSQASASERSQEAESKLEEANTELMRMCKSIAEVIKKKTQATT